MHLYLAVVSLWFCSGGSNLVVGEKKRDEVVIENVVNDFHFLKCSFRKKVLSYVESLDQQQRDLSFCNTSMYLILWQWRKTKVKMLLECLKKLQQNLYRTVIIPISDWRSMWEEIENTAGDAKPQGHSKSDGLYWRNESLAWTWDLCTLWYVSETA